MPSQLQGHSSLHTRSFISTSSGYEIDHDHLEAGNQVALGSFRDIYKGNYYGLEVAIKVLKAELLNAELLKEFYEEVKIMRKIHHRNVEEFIGACTQPPNLCIVTEFMSRGNLYNLIHKQRSAFKLPSLIRNAIDISRGMEYLHNNSIIHGNLKSANLLINEYGGLRPVIPRHAHPKLVQLIERCWHQDPYIRPSFSEIIDMLEEMECEVSSLP